MSTKKRRKLKVKNLIILLSCLVLAIAGIVFLVKALQKTQPKQETQLNQQEEEVIVDETPTPEESEDPNTTISVFFTGDGLLHESVYIDAQNADGTFNFDKQMHYIKDIVSKYDVAYYNQETILGGTALGLSGYPTFNSPTEFGDYMVSAGFNLVSTANNHCLDRGSEGIQNSHDFWKSKEGVLMQGTNVSQEEYDAIESIEVKGIRIAFLSYTYGTNGINPATSYQVNYYRGHEAELLEKIKKAKESNDVVFVAMHWGDEYSMEVNTEQTSLAKDIIEAGADILIGNHPHVIQPYQSINGKPVFYAMGNLISSQLNEENLIGMIGGLDITKTPEGEITIEHVRCDLVYTTMEGVYPALRYNIEVIPFDKLNDSILPNYKEIYERYENIIISLDDSVEIGGV